MQKSLVVSLCVFATFVLIEGRPWYDEGFDGDYGYSSENDNGNDEMYRADDGYGYNQGQSRVSGYGGSGYPSGGRGGGIYPEGGRGGGGYPSTERGWGGYPSDSRGGSGSYPSGGNGSYGNGGYDNSGYGNSGFSNGGYGVGRGSGRGGGGRAYNYVPENCPGCNIKTFGVGRGMTNTFNLPTVR